MEPISCPQSTYTPPQAPSEYLADFWEAFHNYSSSSRQNVRYPMVHTHSLFSCAAPCFATGELNWYPLTQHLVQLGWYVGDHFLVAASRHPLALFHVSPMPHRSLRSWHRPTHSVPSHLSINLHGLDHLTAQSPQSQILYTAASCLSSHHPSLLWSNLLSSWVLRKPHGANHTLESAQQASGTKKTLPIVWRHWECLEPCFLASTTIYHVPSQPPTPALMRHLLLVLDPYTQVQT